MSADYAFKLGYELWLCAMVLSLGLGAGTALVRGCRLPTYCWLPVTFGAACALSYGLFWIYFFDVHAGRLAAVLCWCASLALFIAELSRTGPAGTRPAAAMLRERDAWLPGVMMLVLTAAYLCLLLPRDAAVNDYIRNMPPDNVIPLLFANRLDPQLPQIGPRPHFLIADWLSSDRPPLESAVLLAIRPFASHLYPDLAYQAVGTICQMGWVVALYALARRLQLTRRQAAYALASCACSGFFLANSIYVWPKLLAAWLFIAALTLIVHAAVMRRSTWGVTLVTAALLALSLLAHGGAFFPLLALPMLWLLSLWRPRVTPAQAIAAIAVAVAFLAPWVVYQRVSDPPGNRMLKGHLAGVSAIDDRGTVEAIVQAYAKLTVPQYLSGRWLNVRRQFEIDARGPDEPLSDWIRRQQFFHHLAALDALSLGLLGLWWRSREPHAGAALRRVRWLLAYAAAAMVIWCVLMFGPGSAIVHHGSYAVTMLLFFCAGAGLAELPRAVRVAAFAVHVLLFAVVWLVPRPMSGLPAVTPWQEAPVLVGIVLLAAFAVSLRAWPRGEAADGADDAL